MQIENTTRREVLRAWHKRKQESVCHPFLEEKNGVGIDSLVADFAAGPLSSGDLDAYPPFLWKQVLSVLLLITYDVNTETPEGKNASAASPENVRAMDSGFSIPFLNVFSTLRNIVWFAIVWSL